MLNISYYILAYISQYVNYISIFSIVVKMLILHAFHTKWIRQPFKAVRHPGT